MSGLYLPRLKAPAGKGKEYARRPLCVSYEATNSSVGPSSHGKDVQICPTQDGDCMICFDRFCWFVQEYFLGVLVVLIFWNLVLCLRLFDGSRYAVGCRHFSWGDCDMVNGR